MQAARLNDAAGQAWARAPTNTGDKRSTFWLVGPMFLMLIMIATGTRGLSAASAASDGEGLFAGMTLASAAVYLWALLLVIKNWVGSAWVLRQTSLLVIVVVLYILASAYWSAYWPKVVLNWGHNVGIFLVAVSAALATVRSRYAVPWAILLATLIILLGSIAVSIGMPAYGLDPERLNRWRGLTGNPNTLGAFALIAVWAVITTLGDGKSGIRLLLQGLTVTAALVCFWGTNSMTSGVLAAFVMVSMPVTASLFRARRDRLALKVLFLGFVLIVTLAAVAAIDYRLFDYEYLLGRLGRDTTLTGRTALWELALAAHEMRPWLGWSFDSHLSASDEFGLTFGQFHNGYLDVLVKGGWIGLIILFVLIGATAFRILRLRVIAPRMASILAILVVVVLVHNLTEASFMRPRSLLWLLFLYGYLASGALLLKDAASSRRKDNSVPSAAHGTQGSAYRAGLKPG